VALDTNGLEVLSRDECSQLLSTARVGRLGISVSALPVVLPVNFAVMDGYIVVRTGPGTKLDAALASSVVAFEVDAVDEGSESGWSVLVQGVATVIAEPAELTQARALRLRAWAGGSKDRFVKISTDIMSGRRLAPERQSQPLGHAAADGARPTRRHR
jgi:hypothetical protein